MKLSVITPSINRPQSARTIKVFVACLFDNATTDLELLLDNHTTGDAYVSYNALAKQASGDFLVMVDNDNYFAPGWDKVFLENASADLLQTGCIVESGMYPVNENNYKHNFGYTPESYDRAAFERVAPTLSVPTPTYWGFPWFVQREAFLSMGGFDTSVIGQHEGEMCDLYFWQRWQAEGKHVIRVPVWTYHLMKWTSRDFKFGEPIRKPGTVQEKA